MTELRAGGATDVGTVRSNNQDSYLVSAPLFAVADGMGGHAAGEVASQIAVETLQTEFARNPTADGLADAVRAANQAVWDRAQAEPELRGMGTTLTAVALIDDDGQQQLAVANVGDSRAYLLRSDELDQVTEDHSLVEELVRDGQLSAEEARRHPQRHILTRALGIAEAVHPDCYRVLPVTGDRWLLATDGLFNELSDAQMASTLRRFADPDDAARELVRLAKEHGGADNITVVLVDVVDDGGQAAAASATLSREDAGHDSAPPADPAALPPTAAATPPARPSDEAEDDGPGGNISQARRDAALRGLSSEDEAHGGAEHWRDEPSEEAFGAPKRRFTAKAAAFVLALVLLLGAAVGSVVWYANASYYVGLDGDLIAIYKGRPGGLLWFDPTLEEYTSYQLDDVRSVRHDDLRTGHVVSSMAEARRYIDRLAEESGADSPFQSGDTLPPTTTTTTVAPAPPPPPPA